MTSPRRTLADRRARVAATGVLLGLAGLRLSAQGGPESVFGLDLTHVAQTLQAQVLQAFSRLPLAAALGGILALRPRRRGTPLLFAALWVIEGLEPETRMFELSIRLGPGPEAMRRRIESVLQEFGIAFEVRGEAQDEVAYLVTMPNQLHTDRVSSAVTALVPSGACEVVWKAKTKDKTSI